MCKIHYFSN